MANKSKKINFFAPGFIIPMLYSTISGIILILAYLLAKNPQMFSQEFSGIIVTASTISMVFSPPALVICGPLAIKHRNKYPLESAFYSELPMVLSFLIAGYQIFNLYLMTL